MLSPAPREADVGNWHLMKIFLPPGTTAEGKCHSPWKLRGYEVFFAPPVALFPPKDEWTKAFQLFCTANIKINECETLGGMLGTPFKNQFRVTWALWEGTQHDFLSRKMSVNRGSVEGRRTEVHILYKGLGSCLLVGLGAQIFNERVLPMLLLPLLLTIWTDLWFWVFLPQTCAETGF